MVSQVSMIMRDITEVFCLQADERLDYQTISRIFKSGFSRIPVYDRDKNDMLGLLLTKDLILLDPEDSTPVRNVIR
jgi:metal transporter CNNM